MQRADMIAENSVADAILRKEHATKIAKATVSKAINEAIAWIESDPDEFFLYKYPIECVDYIQNRLQFNRTTALDAKRSTSSQKGRRNSVRAVTENGAKCIDWLRINEFSLHQLVQLVYDYLSLWRLTPNTQYMVRLANDAVCQKPQGSTYAINALFTRQPQRELVRSSPLTMAQVDFKVHVSHLLPKFYPVMLTYRFENCHRDYYAIGNRRVSRLDFQRFFIDMALEAKLGLYAQLLKTLVFPTELKFADNQKGLRNGAKTREREAIKRLTSKPTLCLCGRAESEKPKEEENNDDKETLREDENDCSVYADTSLMPSFDQQETDNKKAKENCERVNEYFEFLESYGANE
ncbi:uncharacterized protein [Eurosta solidaginis]|uniref:uncharacterized protein n=1 Tax=Eurosta solidaginis TaxID=178769 RepID=UPI00353111D6